MKIQTRVVGGKATTNRDKIGELFASCVDGEYLINLEAINPYLTPRDYQKAYFEKIETCVKHTGYKRQELHEMFKKHSEIESTKNMTIVDWIQLFTKLTWWAYSSFDCLV